MSTPITSAAELSTFLLSLEPKDPEDGKFIPKARLKCNPSNGDLTWGKADPLSYTSNFEIVLSVVRQRLDQVAFEVLPSEQARESLQEILVRIQQQFSERSTKYHSNRDTFCSRWLGQSPQITPLVIALNTKLDELHMRVQGLAVRAIPPPPPKNYAPGKLSLKSHKRAVSQPANGIDPGETAAEAAPPAKPLPATAKGVQFAVDADALANVQLRKRAGSVSNAKPAAAAAEFPEVPLSVRERTRPVKQQAPLP